MQFASLLLNHRLADLPQLLLLAFFFPTNTYSSMGMVLISCSVRIFSAVRSTVMLKCHKIGLNIVVIYDPKPGLLVLALYAIASASPNWVAPLPLTDGAACLKTLLPAVVCH